MKPTLSLAAALVLAACKPAPPPEPPAPPTPVQTSLRTGEYWCYAAGGVVLNGQGFVIPEAGRYHDVGGGNVGTFVIDKGEVRFTGGHFDGSAGRNLKADTFRIGTAMECAPKP